MATILGNFISVLQMEISEMKQNDIVVQFVPTKLLKKGEPQLYYCIAEDEIKLPDGAKIEIIDRTDKVYSAEILASDDFGFVVATYLNLELKQNYRLKYNLAWILEALVQWMEETNPASLGPIARGVLQTKAEFVPKTYPRTSVLPNDDLNNYQNEAISHALRHNLTFIWGPPGTGKSKTISELIANYLASGLSVLFVSQSNIAVDVVARRIQQYGHESVQTLRRKGLLVRAGHPSL